MELNFYLFSPDLNPKVCAHVKVDKVTIVQRILSQVELLLLYIKSRYETIDWAFSFSYRNS